MAIRIPVIPFNPQGPAGIPTPPDNTTSGTGSSPGNANPPSNSTAEIPAGPKPQRIFNGNLVSKLLRPSLTSHFQCVFNPPNIGSIRKYYLDGGETITLLCSDASLPGSSILTNEINDDYTGVTERLGYRKQYDDRADFTFYVDHGTKNGGYNVIRLFEEWIRYAMGEKETTGPNYSYRVRFPDEPGSGYRNDMFIQKFERDFDGNYLEYVFVKAYPISIASMPVSYDSSQLLKCTVSFTYNRYVLRSRQNVQEKEPSQQPATGVPQNPQFGIDRTGQFGQTGQNLTIDPFGRGTVGNLLGRAGPGF